jgi:hypothetical protein
LLPHDMRSPPMSASRRRTTGAISTMSASPSKRSRIGEFRFSVSK